jgi:hypothetical protein
MPWTGYSELGYKTSGSIKAGEFLDQLSDYKLFNTDYAASKPTQYTLLSAAYYVLSEKNSHGYKNSVLSQKLSWS